MIKRSQKKVGEKLSESYFEQTLSRIHERTISLRFLCIVLRVFSLEVSIWIY
jgi:hypothetical protein